MNPLTSNSTLFDHNGFMQPTFVTQRYPIIWQGKLALKNDSAAVQIHFVSGNMELGQASLPKHMESQDGAGLAELRIVQRMRTNAEQMNSLRDRMTVRECCVSI